MVCRPMTYQSAKAITSLSLFLPRHGSKHMLPPHKIPYKANLMALKMIGVEYIIGTCIAGSLKKK